MPPRAHDACPTSGASLFFALRRLTAGMLTAACVVAGLPLTAMAQAPHDHSGGAPADALRAVASGSWSAARTWGGKVPAPHAEVVIPAGRDVVLDVSPPHLRPHRRGHAAIRAQEPDAAQRLRLGFRHAAGRDRSRALPPEGQHRPGWTGDRQRARHGQQRAGDHGRDPGPARPAATGAVDAPVAHGSAGHLAHQRGGHAWLATWRSHRRVVHGLRPAPGGGADHHQDRGARRHAQPPAGPPPPRRDREDRRPLAAAAGRGGEPDPQHRRPWTCRCQHHGPRRPHDDPRGIPGPDQRCRVSPDGTGRCHGPLSGPLPRGR